MKAKDKIIEEEKFNFYWVLNLDSHQQGNLFKIVESVLKAGCRSLQLRGKKFDDRDLFLIGKKIKNLTLKYKVKLIVNDRPDLCLALEADGVHLGQADLPPSKVREIIGPEKTIGLSTHNRRELVSAERDYYVDYISIGPIFKSPTKPHLEPVGVEIIDEVGSELSKPLIAIGGINKNNVEQLYNKGLTGIAVASAVLSDKNIKVNTENLINKLRQL